VNLVGIVDWLVVGGFGGGVFLLFVVVGVCCDVVCVYGLFCV
jgi:hypothetical protein